MLTELLVIFSKLSSNKDAWMDLIKLYGMESTLKLTRRKCEADYMRLSDQFKILLKNVNDDICDQFKILLKNVNDDICENSLNRRAQSLSEEKCQQLQTMVTREINKCDLTPCKNLISKCEEGSEEGAKSIESTIFYIAWTAIWAAVCAISSIYNIIKAYEQKSESGQNKLNYKNWLPETVLAVVGAIATFWLVQCKRKFEVIKKNIDDIINQVIDVKSSIETLEDELKNVRELLLPTEDMKSLTGRYSRLQEKVKKFLAKK